MEETWGRMKRYPNLYGFLGSLAVGVIWGCILGAGFGSAEFMIVVGVIFGIFLVHPLALTLFNLVFLCCPGSPAVSRAERRTAFITLVLGMLYTSLYNGMDFGCSGIYESSLITMLFCAGIIGCLPLLVWDIDCLPPLVAVLSMAAVCVEILTGALAIVIFLMTGMEDWPLYLLPVNGVLIGANIIRRAAEQRHKKEESQNTVKKKKTCREESR